MKKRSAHLALATTLAMLGSAWLVQPEGATVQAQARGAKPQPKAAPIVAGAVRFAVTPAIRDMEPAERLSTHKSNAEIDKVIPNKPIRPDFAAKVASSKVAAGDLVVQRSMPEPNIPAPNLSFDGVDNAANAATFGFRVSPPDTNGDVGPTQYVQTVNLLMRVFDKTGVPLTAAIPMSTLFASLGGVCATTDDGDPIVLYDSYADRWIVSQFGLPNFPNPPFHQCIAVSQTGDATGAYYAYDFITPGANLNDYPHFGIWPDAYYMTDNQFLAPALNFNGAGMFAFDRAKMLVGDPTASFIYFDLSTVDPSIGGMLPADADGLTPPAAGAPGVFSYFTADEFGDPQGDGLRIFEFHADFAVPANSTFIEQPFVPVAAFNPLTPAGRADIEQPPPALSSHALDTIGDRIMHRLQYRNFGTHESIVVNHTVNVGTGTTLATHQAGVRYYELRRPIGGDFAMHEQATFAPDTDNRWMGSAALDSDGNLAVGYSVSSLTTFPSVRYAGRLATDPPGGLFQGENTLVAGSGVQQSTGSRWGDYSALTVDPTDDCSFWYTQEYYTAASQATSTVGWVTRIGRFAFAQCTPPDRGTLVVNVTDCATGLPLPNASVSIDNNPYGATLASGSFTTDLAPGSFSVVVSKTSYLSSTPAAVVITNGATTTLNVCLNGIAIPVASSATLQVESCAPANNAVDPGERATFAIALANAGTFPTSNLVATLQPSANVTAPSAPQNYGAIPPGGTASRLFSFTAAGACGSTITLTFQLQDGAVNYGTVSFNVTLGALVANNALSENFDGVVAPALPAGWTTSTTGIGTPWATSTTFSVSAPNSAAVGSVANIGTSSLDSPSVALAAGSTGVLSFQNFFNLETSFDGGVLELSINGGAFQDIIAAGGSFVAGGYNMTISTSFGSPIGGRQAWSGNSGAFITTTVNLPAAALGQNVVFRFRSAYDNSVSPAGAGWRVDNLTVSTSAFVCTASCGTPRLVVTSTQTRTGATQVTSVVSVTNNGTTTANNVFLTQALWGTSTGTPLPQSLGSIPVGGSASATIVFNGAPAAGTSAVLKVGGTYTGGTFSSSRKVVAP